MKKIFFGVIVFLFLFSGNIQAQQIPHYTQYMYNMNILNPAYAGSKGTETVSFGTLYRSQWHNEPGAPKTLTFFVNGALNDHHALGLSFVNDKYGIVSQNTITLDYAYTLHFATSSLALGLKGGVNLFNVGLGGNYVTDPGDPLLNDINDIQYNVGPGLLFYSNKYYLSLSSPNLLKNEYNKGKGYKSTDELHLFLSGGYVFEVGNNFQLKPNFLISKGGEMPLSYDLNLNMMFIDKFEVGFSYRLKDAMSVMLHLQLIKNLWMGYAYDRHISDIRFYSSGSHEFFLNYDWSLAKKVMLSPRYF